MALDWLKNRFEEARDAVTKEVAKFKSKTFMEAAVAGCVMVAHADGAVSAQEKQKMMGFIRSSDALKVFDTDEVIAVFNKFSANYEFDPAIGEANALQVIVRLKGKDAEARLLVRVCCVIGGADGTFDEKEKTVVRRICNELGLKAGDFDL